MHIAKIEVSTPSTTVIGEIIFKDSEDLFRQFITHPDVLLYRVEGSKIVITYEDQISVE